MYFSLSQPNPVPAAPIKVTPSVLRSVYNVTGEHGAGEKNNNTQATTNFLGQYIEQSDLDKFFQVSDPDTSITTSKIVGANNPSYPGVEAMLDTEYLMGVGKDVNTEWWSTAGGQPNGGGGKSFNQLP